jgi:release factor glutamine methyltransferase
VTIAEALRAAARRLADVSDTARLDAELLMAHALGVSRSEMLLRRMAEGAPPAFEPMVEGRAQHEPIAYITGRQEFYGLDLEVKPAVLIPRADSETLIEAAREAFARRSPPHRILDLGTGSGALVLAALTIWPEAEGVGIDRDPGACAVAQRNAERTGVNVPPLGIARLNDGIANAGAEPGAGAPSGICRAQFRQRDWSSAGWRDGLGRFDLVLANPPYVDAAADLPPSVREFEPAGALFAGAEGLDDYRTLIPQLPSLLTPGGRAILEIGATQGEAVSALAEGTGFLTQVRNDLGGRSRAVILAIGTWQRPGE